MSSSSSQLLLPKQQKVPLLPSVITFFIQSDAFWEVLSLAHLQMLVSTCKGFQAEFVGGSNNNTSTAASNNNKSGGRSKKSTAIKATTTTVYPSMIEHALLAIIRTHPANDSKDWCISITNAKYHFSIGVGVLVKHCAALPADDEFHMSAQQISLFKINHHVPYIPFIDAYRLAVTCGLKGAMERRHQLRLKVKQSARTLSVTMMRGRIPRMKENTDNARKELENQLVALRSTAQQQVKEVDNGSSTKKKKASRLNNVPGEGELRKGLRLLKQLSIDLLLADNLAISMRHTLVNEPNSRTKISTRKLETRVRDLKATKTSLVARYKAHGMSYAPTFMPTEILDGLE